MSKREKIIYLIFGVGCLFVFIGLIPAHYEICEINQYTEHEHCADYQLLPFFFIKAQKTLDAIGVAITALSTIAIAAFTYYLKKSTDRLWDAGERQLSHLEGTPERQLRAYVLIENGRVERDFGSKRLKAILTIKNSGQTPAYDLRHSSAVRFVPLEAGTGFFDDEVSKQKLIIAPNGQVPIEIYSKLDFELENFHQYKAGGLKVLVYGQFKYRDAFKNIQTTDFIFEVTGDLWASKGMLRPTDSGNHAT